MMQLLDFEHDNEGNLVGVTVDYDGERIELERVRPGEWIWIEENDCYICSACGETALNNYRGLSVASEGCPHCRAKMKMKGEKDA